MKIEECKAKSPKTCKSCNGTFPNWIKVDGLFKNLSTRSYCLKCKPYKSNNTKKLSHYKTIDGQECKHCSDCQEWKRISDEWYKSTRSNGITYTNSHCKDCQNQKGKNKALELKQRAISHKGDKCQDCCVVYPSYIYDFHHRDPKQKDFKISSSMARKLSWHEVKKELDKCDILCANCHRDRHYNVDNVNHCP